MRFAILKFTLENVVIFNIIYINKFLIYSKGKKKNSAHIKHKIYKAVLASKKTVKKFSLIVYKFVYA